MDGAIPMASKGILSWGLLASTLLAGCGGQPTDEELKAQFHEHRATFEEMTRICRQHPEITRVGDKTMTRLGMALSEPKDEAERRAVEQIRIKLVQAGALIYECAVSEGWALASFTIYRRGFVFAGELKGIDYFEPQPGKRDEIVANLIRTAELIPITQDGWYVRHTQN